ncbi:hypothetical protein BJF85_12070 [Saccharomonospora sp. CUA-673]|uniref:hypothetical protein n=1 Tax=Saccharomonospora sp. CUA-673 TaxID=1904969 RepID=UPI00095ED646|nr:hypothetical protein [Saccharomonospora sp. CUA-673]OLT48544.1 hypothetical protein BJF85_12070 [Saccharomonospora sp. CUA-673]
MSLMKSALRFAKSAAGRRAFYEAKRLAQDPRTRQQAKEAFDKIRNKGGNGGRGGSGGDAGGPSGGPQPPAGR